MKQIELVDVSRAFGRMFALHRVSLTLQQASVTALVGGNGAGKTTLLNILATLDRPTAGQLSYDGVGHVQFARSARQRIGWVSHDTLVYDDLSGRENLRFFASMYGLSDPESLAERWLDRVGLADVGDRRVHTYSRGMRQRLSVARALLHEPELVLLDEPLTALDQQGRGVILELLAALRDRGAIVVLITHDLRIADDVVDQVVVLRQGKLTYHGESGVLDAFAEHA